MALPFADLHLHTTASDGHLTPSDVVRSAAEIGVRAIAITDHDTVSGCAEAQQAGRDSRVQVVPGVELSTTHNDREVHLLGYGIDIENTDLLCHCEAVRRAREERFQLMLERLRNMGVVLDPTRLRSRADVSTPSRAHLAEALIEQGHAEDWEEVFTRYLSNSGEVYVPLEVGATTDAIALVHAAGGLAVIAHPGLSDTLPFVPELVRVGLDGVEVWHAGHTEKMRGLATAAAEQFGLLKTGGSDAHGRPGVARDRIGAAGLTKRHWELFAKRLYGA